mgnify:CR=1 FL=1
MGKLLNDGNCNKYECFIYFKLESPNFFSDNVLYPCKLYEIQNLKSPHLEVIFCLFKFVPVSQR